jgi:signal transduction histidine kinase
VEKMSELLRREVPMALGTFLTAFLLFDYYIQIEIWRNVANVIQEWTAILVAVTAGLGVINSIIVTSYRIRRRESYWYLEIWMLILLAVTAATGLMGTFGTNPSYRWLYDSFFGPVRGTIYGMVLFAITSAFYRAFRVRTTEAALLLISAVIAMIMKAPMTPAMMPWFMPFSTWVYDILNNVGASTLYILSGLGLLGFAIRVILQKERTTMGVVD